MRALERIAPLVVIVASTVALLPVEAARAQASNVVVLGLTSIEGDVAYATNLSAAIRRAAGQVRGWMVSDRDVGLSQVELVVGCEASDLSCVREIASTVGAQRLIYGTIQRSGTGARFDFRIRVHLYDAASQSVLRTVEETLPSILSDIDDLREPARRIVSRLAEAGSTVAGAASIGLPPEGVAADAAAGDADAMRASDVADSGQRSGSGSEIERLNWPALAFLAAGVGAAIGWVVAGLDAMANRDLVKRFETGELTGERPLAADASNPNICHGPNITANAPRRAAQIQGACDSPAEILQFVFMGATVIAGATGIGLLAANGMIASETEDRRARLRLVPRASLSSGSLTLELSF